MGPANTNVVGDTALGQLEKLEKLRADEYIVATGARGRQFYATSNGYSAVRLPKAMLLDLSTGLIHKIIWASFGSHRDAWFFAFQMKDGAHAFRFGSGTSPALHQYIAQLSVSKLLVESLRIQLGDNDSFLAWSGSSWAASGIPLPLLNKLCSLSSATREVGNIWKGSFKPECWPLGSAQWSRQGSFYLHFNGRHMGDWRGRVIRDAWHKLWQDEETKDLRPTIQNELAYVAIDPHALAGDAFTFFRKQSSDREPTYIFRFDGEAIHTNIESGNAERQTHANLLQPLSKPLDEPALFRWATCRKAGRPHRTDTWELMVEKGEKVKVFRDMGRDWFIAQGKKGAQGWVHGTWLDFGGSKLPVDPQSAYMQFREDLHKVLVPGQLCEFLAMRNYVDSCTKPDCRALKEDADSLGVCVHDLLVLLRGSGEYSYEWLKVERNLWHPDRFTRFCHATHAARLKQMAEQMFVLFGVLMEMSKEEMKT